MTVNHSGQTSTTYAHPYRPRALAWMNRLGRTLDRQGVHLPSLHLDGLVKAARRRTGLADFGDTRFRVPLGVLLQSIEREAKLHWVGRWITRVRLVNMLANRLRLQRLIAAHPELATRAVAAPIIVTGLQRSGTTLLHRLLGAVPGARTMRSFETLNPIPLSARTPDSRIRAAHRAQRALAYMAPDFFAIHPVEALEPEEEVVVMDHAFLSTAPEATMHVPSYAAWLENADQAPAYRLLKIMMNAMAWYDAQPASHWVLKTPHHLEWLETLLAMFPDAVIVQCHRDPQVTMGSFCSMVAHARGVFSDHVDAREIGRHWSRKCVRMVLRAMDARQRLEARGMGTFIDILYDDLVADPMAQLARIHNAAGRPLNTADVRAVERARSVHRKHKYGRHVYRLSDFGVDPAAFEQRIAPYRRKFSIPAR